MSRFSRADSSMSPSRVGLRNVPQTPEARGPKAQASGKVLPRDPRVTPGGQARAAAIENCWPSRSATSDGPRP